MLRVGKNRPRTILPTIDGRSRRSRSLRRAIATALITTCVAVSSTPVSGASGAGQALARRKQHGVDAPRAPVCPPSRRSDPAPQSAAPPTTSGAGCPTKSAASIDSQRIARAARAHGTPRRAQTRRSARGGAASTPKHPRSEGARARAGPGEHRGRLRARGACTRALAPGCRHLRGRARARRVPLPGRQHSRPPRRRRPRATLPPCLPRSRWRDGTIGGSHHRFTPFPLGPAAAPSPTRALCASNSSAASAPNRSSSASRALACLTSSLRSATGSDGGVWVDARPPSCPYGVRASRQAFDDWGESVAQLPRRPSQSRETTRVTCAPRHRERAEATAANAARRRAAGPPPRRGAHADGRERWRREIRTRPPPRAAERQ